MQFHDLAVISVFFYMSSTQELRTACFYRIKSYFHVGSIHAYEFCPVSP